MKLEGGDKTSNEAVSSSKLGKYWKTQEKNFSISTYFNPTEVSYIVDSFTSSLCRTLDIVALKKTSY